VSLRSWFIIVSVKSSSSGPVVELEQASQSGVFDDRSRAATGHPGVGEEELVADVCALVIPLGMVVGEILSDDTA